MLVVEVVAGCRQIRTSGREDQGQEEDQQEVGEHRNQEHHRHQEHPYQRSGRSHNHHIHNQLLLQEQWEQQKPREPHHYQHRSLDRRIDHHGRRHQPKAEERPSYCRLDHGRRRHAPKVQSLQWDHAPMA